MGYHSELCAAIKNNQLVAFTGAGISSRFNLPPWKKLVAQIIEALAADYANLRPFRELVESDTLSRLEVLNKLEKKHKSAVYKTMRETLKIKAGADFSLHKAILDLTTKVITTNYDKGFEMASNFQMRTIDKSSKFQLANLFDVENLLFNLVHSVNPSCLLNHEGQQRQTISVLAKRLLI